MWKQFEDDMEIDYACCFGSFLFSNNLKKKVGVSFKLSQYVGWHIWHAIENHEFYLVHWYIKIRKL